MTEIQAKYAESELKKLLIKKYPDIQVHIDLINGTDEIVISLFWDRKSIDQWYNAKSFKCKAIKYTETVESEILKDFLH